MTGDPSASGELCPHGYHYGRGCPKCGVAEPAPDFQISNHGSLVLARPTNDTARAWLKENVQEDAQWFGDALVVEPRYLTDLALGMFAAGLTTGF